MKVFEWREKRITQADYLIQFTAEEIRELDGIFPEVSRKCCSAAGFYYGFVDLQRKLFIPLKSPRYVFGGCYQDYPPYRKEDLGLRIDFASLSWQEDVDMVLNYLLEKAMRLARTWFAGRTDKSGVDYYTGHLKAVAGLVGSREEQIVAFLHDILEDTDYPEAKLREEFGSRIADAVVLLTHREKLDEEGYLDYVRRLKDSGNDLAIAVKIADLTNNSDYTRLGASCHEELSERDRRRWEKYQKALAILA